MLRTLLLAEDSLVALALEGLAVDTQQVQVVKIVEIFPTREYEVALLLSQNDPELVILQGTNVDAALELGLEIRARSDAIGVVVVGPRLPDAMEAPYRKAGIQLLTPPLDPQMLVVAARDAIHHARIDLSGKLFLFVPAKAGSGASTVALNMASALSEGLSQRVLLVEADLHSGLLAMGLNMKPKVALIDVLQNASALDYSVWEKTVLHVGPFDLLPTDRAKKVPLPSWLNYHQLLKFVGPRYDRILADLPEVVNDATAELVHYAKTVFVVCTPELTSLTLAEQRLNELYARGLPPERAEIVVNRWHKNDISTRDLDHMLKSKVAAVIPNDYRAVHKANLAGSTVRPDCDLGKAFLAFAKKLEEPESNKSREASRSLLNALRSARP